MKYIVTKELAAGKQEHCNWFYGDAPKSVIHQTAIDANSIGRVTCFLRLSPGRRETIAKLYF